MQIPIPTKSPAEIPEVQAFEEVKAILLAFREANPQFFQHYDALIEDYNQKREAADKAVRAADVSCGSWDQFQRYTSYDWEKLYEAVGRERFIEAGGKIINKKVFKGDAKRLEMAIAQGVVPKEVADECTDIESKYHSPPVAVVP